MRNATRGAWHTVTVEPDGEDEDGAPVLDYTLDHVDTCAAAAVPDPNDPGAWWPEPRCHLDHIIQEWVGSDPEVIGLPTEPGTYRMRAWYHPGDGYVTEPDDGIEIDEEDTPNA